MVSYIRILCFGQKKITHTFLEEEDNETNKKNACSFINIGINDYNDAISTDKRTGKRKNEA